MFHLSDHLFRQQAFSLKTFGPGLRTKGVSDHIRKELEEIAAHPTDLEEWIDVILLAFDGAYRTGADPQQIIDAIVAKQTKNEGRTWPDWKTADPDKAIEHVRTEEERVTKIFENPLGFKFEVKVPAGASPVWSAPSVKDITQVARNLGKTSFLTAFPSIGSVWRGWSGEKDK